jgi:hypothetical protein
MVLSLSVYVNLNERRNQHAQSLAEKEEHREDMLALSLVVLATLTSATNSS